MPEIHPTAVVDPAARLGAGVRVGPHSVIGPDVVIGDSTVIQNGVTFTGFTTIGRRCEFYTGCVIGAIPQDLKYHGERTTVEIGDDNVFREHANVHAGTAGGGGATRIGNNNLFMVGSHVGHDVLIGNHCIIANLCLLGGHVVVEDYVNIGGHSGVHHFTTLGKYCMIAGTTRITSDVPPFLTVASTRSSRQEVRMVNGVGLKRRGFTEEHIRSLKTAYMNLFSRRARASGVPIIETIYKLKGQEPDENVLYLCDFLLRSFECGRRGRYLESLRGTPPAQQPPQPDHSNESDGSNRS